MTPEQIKVVDAAVTTHRERPGALLPILHAIQDALGFVPRAAIPTIALGLNVSQADVYGVITFYHDFRAERPGRHVMKLCRAEACQAMGCESLAERLKAKHGADFKKTTADGALTLEAVYCLGNCALSPAVMVDGRLHGRVSPERLDALVAAAKVGIMNTKVFVPRDSAAISMGADEVADAIAKASPGVEIVRNGSRGMLWLEPLCEVATPAGRIAYGPVTPGDVKGLLAAGFLTGGAHALRHGPTEEIPYFKKQERLTFARVGVTDPTSLADYEAHGGWRGLRNALAAKPADIVEEVVKSGLRGRGGAAFPAGIKWKTVFGAPAMPKYVVCNADEGDSGTFSDRMIMEGDPYVLIEGMTIAALAVGSQQGYIYLRSEYPYAERILETALGAARKAGFLGPDILGSGRGFDIDLRRGAGAYICGEETALLESLEGKRGMVRPKPPLPAIEGLFGKPTIINNVITLASVPIVLDKGGPHYADFGMGRSRGTLPFQLAGNVKQGGLVEKAFGLTLRELLYDYGGGSATGRPIKAVQVGGPLGAYLPESKFDTPLDYETFAAAGGMVGHGGVVVFDDTVDMSKMARYAMEFCAIESCGKCTPCRIGSTRGVEVIDRVRLNQKRDANVELLRDLCNTLVGGSLCAMGGLTPYPVLSALDNFPEDFGIKR